MNLANPLPNRLTNVPTLPDYAGMLEVLLGGMSTASRRQYQHTFNDWRMWCAQNQTPPIRGSKSIMLMTDDGL